MLLLGRGLRDAKDKRDGSADAQPDMPRKSFVSLLSFLEAEVLMTERFIPPHGGYKELLS